MSDDNKSSRAYRAWEKEAVSFQRKQCKLLGKYDMVHYNQLRAKIEAALRETGGGDSLKLTEHVENSIKNGNKVKCWDIGFTYVHVKVDGDIENYLVRLVCRVWDVSDTKSWLFVDDYFRTYRSWEDYLDNNTLPKGWMCYPKNGFNREGATDIRKTPASSLRTEIFEVCDDLSDIMGGLAMGVSMASMFFNIPESMVKKAATVQTACTAYKTGRSAAKLIDMKQHGESISLGNANARDAWEKVRNGTMTLAGYNPASDAVKTRLCQSLNPTGYDDDTPNLFWRRL